MLSTARRRAPRLTRDEKKAQTRLRLLEAAAHVFARRGYHAATVDEVAEEAGYTVGALYSNFATRTSSPSSSSSGVWPFVIPSCGSSSTQGSAPFARRSPN